jgi:hypothetical protein
VAYLWLAEWTTRKELLIRQHHPNNKREDFTMAKPIQWLPDVDAAKKKAREERKYILLDFFNPL